MLALADERGEPPFLIVADELNDPHNLGAILRTAECTGAHGVIIPKRRSAGLTYTVGKASAGALEYVPVARVSNLAAALEQGSSHPLARAILDKAGDMQLPQVNGFRTLRGLGVSGEAEGHALLLGNQALLNDQQVDTKAIEADISAQASQGATPVLLAVDGKAVALLAVRDPLRSDSVAALQRLHKAGYRLDANRG